MNDKLCKCRIDPVPHKALSKCMVCKYRYMFYLGMFATSVGRTFLHMCDGCKCPMLFVVTSILNENGEKVE